MERLTRKCDDTQNNKYATHVIGKYIGIYKDHDFGKAVERLAYYEDLLEEGRLIILNVEDIHPCKKCDTGWGSVSAEGVISCEDTCHRLKQYHEKYGY